MRCSPNCKQARSKCFAWFKRQLELMPPKAYRWVAEMQEIAGFVGDDPAASDLYEGAARFYEGFAEDFEGDKKAADALQALLGKSFVRLRQDYRFSHRRAKPRMPCGRKIIIAMKTMPSGIR